MRGGRTLGSSRPFAEQAAIVLVEQLIEDRRRLDALDAWTMLLWRGVFGGLFLAGMLVWREQGRVTQAVRDIGRDGLLIALCSALATVCF